jgi:predicted metal-dependent peptidase
MSARRPGRDAAAVGWGVVRAHPLLAACGGHLDPVDHDDLEEAAWALVGPDGWIRRRWQRAADSEEWAWVLAHLVLHLGLGHTDPARTDPVDLGAVIRSRRGTVHVPERAYAAACCVTVDRVLATLRVGRCPYPRPAEPPVDDERELARRWRAARIPRWAEPVSLVDFLVGDEETARRHDFTGGFARGLTAVATDALGLVRGAAVHGREPGPWDQALDWFVTSFPLLGAVATGMTVVADAELARGHHIALAAVDAVAAEIYVNPNTRLTAGEWRFVVGHELLHAALRHDARADGRDAYTWNVACDYVVNGWLVDLEVGDLTDGALYDPALAGMSCEAVYDRIEGDLRRLRRLATLRGRGLGDILNQRVPGGAETERAVDLDAYYRNALAVGHAYHRSRNRGTVPAALEEAIWVLGQPPLAWDIALARWFEENVEAVEQRRTYARRSRRQSASPDVPRPGRVRPVEIVPRHTFGVVLDTSGSMDADVLGKALGAVASYAAARDVPSARVVFCDAAAHDAGYLPVEEIAGRVVVRGRGGTILQPGIDALEAAADFPLDGPILVITDGDCDAFHVRREHAVLVPAGASLPVRPRGPVLRIR